MATTIVCYVRNLWWLSYRNFLAYWFCDSKYKAWSFWYDNLLMMLDITSVAIGAMQFFSICDSFLVRNLSWSAGSHIYVYIIYFSTPLESQFTEKRIIINLIEFFLINHWNMQTWIVGFLKTSYTIKLWKIKFKLVA